MKDTKKEMPFYALYDRTHIERHLEDMAEQGWLLEKMGNYSWRYRRIEPKSLHFSVCYYPKASVFDPELSEGQLEFADFCAHTGWMLAAANGQLQVFYNERENPVPIETDPVLELEAIHKAAKKSVLLTYGIALTVALLNIGSMLLSLFNDPIDWLSRTPSLISGGMMLLLLLMCVVEVGGYFLWRKRAKRAAEHGAFYPTPDHSLFEKICFALVLLNFAWLLISIAFSGSTFIQWTMGLVLTYTALMIAAVNGTRELLKCKKVSASANRAATLGVDIALGVLMMVLIFAGISYEVRHDLFHDDTVTADALPLIVSDLLNIDDSGYLVRCTVNASPLLAQSTVHHYFNFHNKPAGTKVTPGVDYTITDVRAGFLYDFCKERLLKRYYDEREPEEFRSDYQLTAAAPWGAREAYQMIYYDSTPLNCWVLCYDGRIVELTLDWEPTAEQMAIVGEKLGR